MRNQATMRIVRTTLLGQRDNRGTRLGVRAKRCADQPRCANANDLAIMAPTDRDEY